MACRIHPTRPTTTAGNRSRASVIPVLVAQWSSTSAGSLTTRNKTAREQITEFAPGQGTLTNRWAYDPLNQLTRAINVKGTGSNFRGYHLDAEGNRLAGT